LSRTIQPPDPIIVAGSDWPDPDTERARRMLADPPLSKETVYRLGKAGLITGYILAGRRLWTLASIRTYKTRCIDRGSQFASPTAEKRKPGRPKKSKPETSVAAE
jgi:hypothetical protein